MGEVRNLFDYSGNCERRQQIRDRIEQLTVARSIDWNGPLHVDDRIIRLNPFVAVGFVFALIILFMLTLVVL